MEGKKFLETKCVSRIENLGVNENTEEIMRK